MTLIEKKPQNPVSAQASSKELVANYLHTRATSLKLCATMKPEDFVIQSMPDVSPTKWHLAHTAWFFEVFILLQHYKDYTSPGKLFSYLFNSYYNAMGQQFCRPRRGQISRPTVDEIYAYRKHVDEKMLELLSDLDSHPEAERIRELVVLGINHEQQHQELLITDIKHVFFMNPLYPALFEDSNDDAEAVSAVDMPDASWVRYEGGLHMVGYDGDGFHFDNETPVHEVFLRPFEISSRPITNGEYLEFVEDRGYQRDDLWLSLGWATVKEHSNRELDHERFDKPLYWVKQEGQWMQFTLNGLKPLDLDESVTHISYYEADAYARWAGSRLPTEFEWEVAARHQPVGEGNFQENWRFQPRRFRADGDGGPLHQLYGDVWEFTQSAYQPYPGFVAEEGAVGEYNGKFMVNQIVLRGGSCATPRNHIRPTYRNFFYAGDRWQFTGVRLARDIS